MKLLVIILILKNLLCNKLKVKQNDQDCKFESNQIAIDNANNNYYDLLISFSTIKKCNYTCILESKDIEVKGVEEEIQKSFAFQYYTYLRFKNLENFLEYSLSCSSEQNKYSQIIQFPKHQSGETKILSFGDWDKNNGQFTYDLLKKKIPNSDAIVFLGDMAYDIHDDESRKGNEFLKWAINITSSLPFQLTTGNHEAKDDFQNLKTRFLLPNKKQGENLYYSYDINNVHLVSVNSEIPYKKKLFNNEYINKFTKWLNDDLKTTNKTFKIVYLHRPFYCSYLSPFHCGSSAKYMRELYEDILHENNVDLVVAGHVHYYERLYPVYKNEVDKECLDEKKSTYKNPKFTSYVVCGSGGNKEGSILTHLYIKTKATDNINITKGVCELTITKDTINLDFVESSTGNILDNFKIIKTK